MATGTAGTCRSQGCEMRLTYLDREALVKFDWDCQRFKSPVEMDQLSLLSSLQCFELVEYFAQYKKVGVEGGAMLWGEKVHILQSLCIIHCQNESLQKMPLSCVYQLSI